MSSSFKTEKTDIVLSSGGSPLILNLGCGDDMTGEVRIDKRTGAHALNIMGDALGLPFRDKVFGETKCYSVLEHMGDPHKGLLEMTRVTKSKLYIKIPNVYFFKRILRALLNPGYSVKSGTLHLQAWDLLAFKRLIDQIETVEILVVEWVDFVFKFFGVLIKWPSLFFGWNMLVTMVVEENRSMEGKDELKLGKCGYEYNPFECQKMPCYSECETSGFKEESEPQSMEETTN